MLKQFIGVIREPSVDDWGDCVIKKENYIQSAYWYCVKNMNLVGLHLSHLSRSSIGRWHTENYLEWKEVSQCTHIATHLECGMQPSLVCDVAGFTNSSMRAVNIVETMNGMFPSWRQAFSGLWHVISIVFQRFPRETMLSVRSGFIIKHRLPHWPCVNKGSIMHVLFESIFQGWSFLIVQLRPSRKIQGKRQKRTELDTASSAAAVLIWPSQPTNLIAAGAAEQTPFTFLQPFGPNMFKRKCQTKQLGLVSGFVNHHGPFAQY